MKYIDMKVTHDELEILLNALVVAENYYEDMGKAPHADKAFCNAKVIEANKLFRVIAGVEIFSCDRVDG